MSVTTENSDSVERISELAMNLCFKDRALLLDRLHDSLRSPEEKEIDEAWLNEAVRRAEEVRSGLVVPIDSDVVFAEARARLRR